MISEADFVGVQGSLNEMMCAVCDHAHDRCVKVIVARSKVSILIFKSGRYCMLGEKNYHKHNSKQHVILCS